MSTSPFGTVPDGGLPPSDHFGGPAPAPVPEAPASLLAPAPAPAPAPAAAPAFELSAALTDAIVPSLGSSPQADPFGLFGASAPQPSAPQPPAPRAPSDPAETAVTAPLGVTTPVFGSPATTTGEPDAADLPEVAAQDDGGRGPFAGARGLLTGARGSGGKKLSPVLAIALAGGAVVLGGLAAVAVVTSTSADPTAAALSTPAPSASATASAPSTPGPSASATETAAPAASQQATAFTAGSRDPFTSLVADAGGVAGGASGVATSGPATSGTGTTDGTGTTGLLTGVLPGLTGVLPGAASGTGTTVGGALGSTGSATSTGSSSASASSSPTAVSSPTASTTAQVCAAASDPMATIEQVLGGQLAGTTAPTDAGTALRVPVTQLRAAVGSAADASLASRLDIAASGAESLRAQLIGGTPVTADQVATQVSRDTAVRTACGG